MPDAKEFYFTKEFSGDDFMRGGDCVHATYGETRVAIKLLMVIPENATVPKCQVFLTYEIVLFYGCQVPWLWRDD